MGHKRPDWRFYQRGIGGRDGVWLLVGVRSAHDQNGTALRVGHLPHPLTAHGSSGFQANEGFLLGFQLRPTACYSQLAAYYLTKVVYRGYSTSSQLQSMHDDAIAKRTKLRLTSDTIEVEQAQQAVQLRCKQERSEQEQQLGEAAKRHAMSLQELDHKQKIRQQR